MREAQFLKQNAEKWKQYERDLHTQKDPDTFADRFIELTDDLSYSKTFYKSSNTTKYLNGLTAQFHQKIYKNKKEKASRILQFWQFELPYLFRQYHRQLLYSFLFFTAFCLVGALSAKYDENFIRMILGDNYVNMTNENIEKGDPFAVYKHAGQLTMFFGIAFKNIRVAFLAFVSGITFSIGTVMLIIQNGLMMGSFEYYFFSKGLGVQSLLAIFIHGTLELSAIVIAGCAGLIMGSSLLFPQTFGRWESILKGGRDGMKIVLGLVPFFLMAAFLESFVTRYYKQIPLWLNLGILGLSLWLIIGYFIWYPILLHRRIAKTLDHNKDPSQDQNLKLWLNRKLTSGK